MDDLTKSSAFNALAKAAGRLSNPTIENFKEQGGKLSIRKTDSIITFANRWDHTLARWGYKRNQHRVQPGLYALGNPTPDSPVFVTANYTLSFDALRSSLASVDGYILVLDTQGINVWCAAGKRLFSTDVLLYWIMATGLNQVVRHGRLILPQLGAPGISAHEVRKHSGFKVEYGPVRAADLQEYIKTGSATSGMRRVTFSLRDRLVLIPVELSFAFLPTSVIALIFFFLSGHSAATAYVTTVLVGIIIFPILMPFIPVNDLSLKGFILGTVTAIPFALTAFLRNTSDLGWIRIGWPLVYLFAMSPMTAFLALNYTGVTPFTSRSRVKHEIFTYFPMIILMVSLSLILAVILTLNRL